MVSFLLMISFFIHVATFCCLFFMFKKLQSGNGVNQREMIELFETYLEEIKEENRRLQEELDQVPAVSTKKDNSGSFKDGKSDLERPESHLASDYFPNDENDKPDQMETSLEANVLQLYYQGFSILEISQKLNCGKTEVELIIKLYEKK